MISSGFITTQLQGTLAKGRWDKFKEPERHRELWEQHKETTFDKAYEIKMRNEKQTRDIRKEGRTSFL
jgi:hypothetical protein